MAENGGGWTTNNNDWTTSNGLMECMRLLSSMVVLQVGQLYRRSLVRDSVSFGLFSIILQVIICNQHLEWTTRSHQTYGMRTPLRRNSFFSPFISRWSGSSSIA